MKDYSSDSDFDSIDPEVEALFYLSDEELSELIRRKFGDEQEFVEKASSVFDRALAEFSGKSMANLKVKGSADVIDIRSRLAQRPAPPSVCQLYKEKPAAEVVSRRVAVSLAFFVVATVLLASPIVETLSNRAVEPKDDKVITSPLASTSGPSLEKKSTGAPLEKKLIVRREPRALVRMDSVFGGLLMTLDNNFLLEDFANFDVFICYYKPYVVADNFKGVTSVYESRELTMGASDAGAPRVSTSVIILPFDAHEYALALTAIPQSGAGTSGFKIDSFAFSRLGFAPDGPSVRD